MEKTVCLYGGSIFNGERLYPKGAILFSEKGIIRVIEGDDIPPAENSFNLQGRLIVPGLVDLHSDALEKCIESRPGVYFDAEFALMNLDRRLVLCGLPSFCHAISFAEDEFGLRSCDEAEALVHLIHKFNKSDKAAVNHLIHARFEISNPGGESILARLINENLIDMASIMDHTPGQGQFKTLESYIAYHAGTYKVTPEQITALVEHKTAMKEETMKQVVRVGQLVRESNIPFLSHDDDTAEKVSFVRELGVNASEFPVSMEAAKAAKRFNMKVFMGAPNLIRGCSSNNHLKASDALKAGICDALVSDYYPECLLQAPFTASKRHNINLQETLKMVISNPGDYLKQRIKAGRLIEGVPADLIIVDHTGPWVRTAQTWVSGRCVYNSNV